MLGTGFRRIRWHGYSVLTAAIAAGISFAIASLLFEPQNAFFAPIAAVISVGLAAGQRIQRAVEIVAGVTIGIVLADLVLRYVPVGPITLTLTVLVAMSIAVALRTSTLFVNQTAVAAVVAVVLAPQASGGPFQRLGDALIGGAVALAISVTTATSPTTPVRRVMSETFDAIAREMTATVAALRERDPARAGAAVDRLGRVRGSTGELASALQGARESVRIGKRRRELQRELTRSGFVRARLDVLLATLQTLARYSANAARSPLVLGPGIVDAISSLVPALNAVPSWARGQADVSTIREPALEAARLATATLSEPVSQTAHVIVGLVRSASVDLLRLTGMGRDAASTALREAAGDADAPGL
ncbi:FUSC family protein [Herbiconiux sp. SYSU D00978]|uniref:FUSC family protein n=1 Tax=Herbiconiux sp. SYSU D00978 TaxID=2812562 RepID=UPI001A97BEAE|nr:FUSC family protein [Herbiconiux sp. SYSU D00978]